VIENNYVVLVLVVLGSVDDKSGDCLRLQIVFVDVAENVEGLMEKYGFTSDDIHVLGTG